MPGIELKIIAMPTASDTAPPVRPATVSPMLASIPAILIGASVAPWNVIVW